MRRRGLLFAGLAISGWLGCLLTPAVAQEEMHHCKKVRRATVWSVDAERGYLVVSDEQDRQAVVNQSEVQVKSRSRRSNSQLRSGDVVIVCCHVFR